MMPAPEVTDPPLAGAPRVAVVTGARGNLGAACARALLEDGYRVAAVDLFPPPAPGDHPPQLAWFRADVTVPADVTRSREQIAERWGPVAILVNAAGVARASRFAQISLDEWRHVLDVSLTGSFLMTQAFLPDMRAAGFGRVINFSSTAGKNVSTLAGVHYTTAKAGVLGLTRALAKELGPSGITVNAVCPGLFETEMARSLAGDLDLDAYAGSLPVPRLGQPWEVAALVSYLASDRAGYVTGAALDINGGELMT